MSTLAVRVQKRYGERVRSILYEHGLLSRYFQIRAEGEYLDIPVGCDLPEQVLRYIGPYGAESITMDKPLNRSIPLEPFEKIEAEVDLPDALRDLLPRKWELVGDVLLLKFHDDLRSHRHELAGIYARVLGAKTVLEERSGISGITRKPDVEVIFGTDSETVHVENSIKYMLDTKELMFSKGNISERLRMAEIDCSGETVVDMFAGIGYFSLPLAVYGNPARLISCEINPVSFEYLERNTDLNGVAETIDCLQGDCRDTAPEHTADRVLMGLIKRTSSFLPKAMKVLKPEGGIIHYHDTVPEKHIPGQPLDIVKTNAEKAGFNTKLLNHVRIKSYAPGIHHVVLDLKLTK